MSKLENNVVVGEDTAGAAGREIVGSSYLGNMLITVLVFLDGKVSPCFLPGE